MMPKGRLIVLVAIVAALMAVTWYVWYGKSVQQDTVTVSRETIVRAAYATGTVEPVHWAKLAPQKTSRLMEILRHEGDRIKKGDVVARMENRVEMKRLEEAQAHLDFANKELARNLALSRQSAISRKQLEDSQREQKEAQAQMQAIQRELDDLTLITPVDGVVLRRDIELGETVQAGEVIFWVGKPKPLRITTDVDEEDIAQVRLGQKALIKADAFPGETFEGSISEITPKGDPVNKVFRVRLSLPDSAPLLTGMTTEVNIITQTLPNALVVPAESESDGKVWRIKSGKALETAVKTGIRDNMRVEIKEGLQEGDIILRQAPIHPGQ